MRTWKTLLQTAVDLGTSLSGFMQNFYFIGSSLAVIMLSCMQNEKLRLSCEGLESFLLF